MPDQFHFMADEIHFMHEPTSAGMVSVIGLSQEGRGYVGVNLGG